ncbi:MAG: hypothetical protein A2908_00390 [Candidatus Staskawiczbacteria bacterium RIFCSPLOWO2_01_FULL_38_12b]|uniref:Uncharacterized protein n=1 Tax=Candidatus Staskawiczbacteria bacterium RIFCSPLOWO2_01_FULL_38_12b TaxID=1802214 RepID=A0A1G2IFK8_9BACT|nr:MAG: hypothetical protein A2908_00390 [Candidatus Staskawiczbacteria bacterium RIFCSPLOWO2_01_FULL_38_12b]
MSKKTCVGCLLEVEDGINSLGIGTICESCKISSEIIPQQIFSEEIKCPNCKGKTNLIGAFKKGGYALLYFDCPNPNCHDRRMTIRLVSVLLK